MTRGLALGSERSIVLVATLFGVLTCGEQPAARDALALAAALQVDPPIVISQVYGGGGNSGASFTHDFVELFNRSSSPVALDTMRFSTRARPAPAISAAAPRSSLCFPQARP